MELQELKDKIKKEFGSYSNFARAAKLDRYEMQRDFLSKKKVDPKLYHKIQSLAGRLKPKGARPKLTPSKIKALRVALNQAGGVLEFTKAFPEFKKETVYQILIGRYPTITGTVQRLLDHFGI